MAKKRNIAGRRSKKNQQFILPIIAVVLVIGGFLFIKNYTPAELQRIRNDLTTIERQWGEHRVTEKLDRNLGAVAELNGMLTLLQKIPQQYKPETVRARKLIDKIAARLDEFEKKNAALQYTAAVESDLNLLLAEYADREGAAAAEFAEKLREFADKYPGTDAAVRAQQKRTSLQGAAREAELQLIRTALEEAGRLADQGDYRNALSRLEASAARTYAFITPADTNALQEAAASIEQRAAAAFRAFADQRLDPTVPLEYTAAAAELKAEFERLSIPAVEPVYQAALDRMEKIRQKQLAGQAKRAAALREQIDELLQYKQYTKVVALCTELIPLIADEQEQDAAQRMRIKYELYAKAKAKVITIVNQQGGVQVLGLGLVKRLSPEQVELQIGNMAMPLGWDKFKDIEFMKLVRKVLEIARDDDDLNLLFASFMAEQRGGSDHVVEAEPTEEEQEYAASGKYPAEAARQLGEGLALYKEAMQHMKKAFELRPSMAANKEFSQAENLLRKALNIYVAVAVKYDEPEINDMIIRIQEQLYSAIKLRTIG